MTQQNLKKMFFMLFEVEDYKHILELHEKYTQLIQDPSIGIIYNIARGVLNNGDLRASLEYLYNAKPTEEFPAPKGFIPGLIEHHNATTTEKYAKIKALPTYYSPGHNMVSVNGNTYDSEMDLVRRVNHYIGDPKIFRNLVNELKDTQYGNYLKLIHSLQTLDIDYGLKAAAEYLNGEVELSAFMIIINLLEAQQRISSDNDISQSEIYIKTHEAVKNTLYALNLAYVRKWYLSELEFLKFLQEVKESLYSTHPKAMVDNYCDNIIKQN